MANFNAAAVRFGMPGILRIADLGATEPTDTTTPWDSAWVPLGYTDEGSVFNYEISTDNVEVAEELDVLARVTTGRDASVEFALAEITYKNLAIAFNGGIISGAGAQDGSDWMFEPPDLGTEKRMMIGWDAHVDPTMNDLRIIFRQCLQGGSIGLENRKGATKSTIAANFQLEKPNDPTKKILAIFGSGNLNPVYP